LRRFYKNAMPRWRGGRSNRTKRAACTMTRVARQPQYGKSPCCPMNRVDAWAELAAIAGDDRRAIANFPWRRRVGTACAPKRPSTPRCNHETLGPGLPSSRRTHFVSGQGVIRPSRRRRCRPRSLAFRTSGACLARGGRRCPGVETPTTLTGTRTTLEPADLPSYSALVRTCA
jgi:hypothetical protein